MNKNIFFHNIHVFINRVKDITRIKSDTLLYQNLQIYLREIAFI